MAWFRKSREEPPRPHPTGARKCDGCGEHVPRGELEPRLWVCPRCGHHLPVGARQRLSMVCDEGTFQERDARLAALDPLRFVDQKKYPERLKAARAATGERDSFLWGTATVEGHPAAVGAFDFRFMGGSMGSVAGEKVARLFAHAREASLAAVIFATSGGARMQEGILSLMQMGKTAAALAHYRGARRPYVSVLLNPTTGGVAASFGWLGDAIFAEPGALIGFTGPRVIEQTLRQKLPEGFQRAEFLVEHGMIDRVVPRAELKRVVGQALGLLG